MIMKRMVSVLLSAILAMGTIAPIYANDEEPIEDVAVATETKEEEPKEEVVSEETTDEMEDVEVDQTSLPSEVQVLDGGFATLDNYNLSNEELFTQYVNEAFGDQIVQDNETLGVGQGYNSLQGVKLFVYSEMRKNIANIAVGKIETTKFKINVEDCKFKVPLKSAGMDPAKLTDADNAKILSELNAELDLNRLLSCWVADCPYELYWFDNTVGVSRLYYYTYDEKEDIIVTHVELSFAVAQDFRKGALNDYTTNKTKTSATKTAVTNAAIIISAASTKDDYNKLLYYSKKICELVDYKDNLSAEQPYGNIWQMLYVFDNDPSTKVVCEGYAKAFKYLCDQSTFVDDIQVILVTGHLYVGGTIEPHMWNVVKMEDGKNYVVDVTNSDDGTSSQGTSIFLKGATPYYGEYKVKAGNTVYQYSFDSDTKSVFSVSQLDLAKNDYVYVSTPIISFEKTSYTIETNTTLQLEPVANTALRYTYTSSNTSVATVDENGLVTGKAKGSATITVTGSRGGKATVKIIVQKPDDFLGRTMSVAGDLTVNFYMVLSDTMKNDTGAYMRTTSPTGSIKRIYVKNVSTVTQSGKKCHVFPVTVSAKDLTGKIKIQMVRGDGTKLTVYTDSPVDYLHSITNSTSQPENTKKIAHSIIRYGYTTQVYFNYKPELEQNTSESLVTSNLDPYQYTCTDANEGVDFEGARMVLGYKPSLKLYFSAVDGYEKSHIFTVDGTTVVPDRDGKFLIVTISEIDTYSHMYQVVSDNLSLSYGIFSFGKQAKDKGKVELKNVVDSLYQMNYYIHN